MDFAPKQHIYRCVPPVLGNEAAEEQVVIWLRGISQSDRDKAKLEETALYLAHTRDKAHELITEAAYALVKDRVASIEGLTLDGKPCNDFDTLYSEGPAELVQWVFAAVFSTVLLTAAEVKN